MMNEHSSRSHTILTVNIHSEEKVASEDNKGVFITRYTDVNHTHAIKTKEGAPKNCFG